ncbi:BBSome-interacting protein 1 [Bradysia coprophila]|uniref:BBSome-interacting protein 1 n=1 Tax=Bradysia coprophila TaxID=38358 RepID=UPI00187DAC77|nr:BBSome-interacting protein 1 [Bradysia coprophila]
MSSHATTFQQELVLPDFGRLFYEQKSAFVFCKPHLMPLKSITLEKLERMQKQAIAQLKETRATTAAATSDK